MNNQLFPRSRRYRDGQVVTLFLFVVLVMAIIVVLS